MQVSLPPANGPVGVAATRTELFASDFCIGLLNPNHRNIETVACDGTFSVLTSIPSFVGDTCEEMYMAIAPIQSANAGFTPRDVFVTNGIFIYRFTPPNPPNPLTVADRFATIPDVGCNPDHTGITFDKVGTFGNNMIVTCQGRAGVWQVDGAGTPTHIADTGAAGALEIEGPAVAPLSFGPFGGQILVADEDRGSVHAIKNDGTVTLDVFAHPGAESVQVVPDTLCTFCSGGAHFQAITINPFGDGPGIYQYFPADFTGLGGDVLVTSEAGAGTVSVHFNGTNYVTQFLR